MKVLQDGSLNFYASKAKMITLAVVFALGIVLGLILFILGQSATGLIIAIACACFLLFFVKPALSSRAFVIINGDIVKLYGCVPFNVKDVCGTRMQSLRASRFLIFDINDMTKYKPNLSQKINRLCGFGYFYVDINALSQQDRMILHSELSKSFPVTYF